MACETIGELNEIKNYRFEWKIPDFSSLIESGTFYCSPSLTYMNRPLRLCTNQPKNLDYLDMYLYYESDYLCSVYATVAFSIKKNNGTLFGTKFANVTREFQPYVSQFLDRSVLRINPFQLLPQDTLTIVCDLETKLDGKKLAAKADSMKDSEHMKLTEIDLLSKNFKDLLSNRDNCDAVLLVQGKEFNVHKSILIARSPVFSAMFRHNTTEKETKEVVIPDCDPNSFQKFLEYLYCGKLEDLSSDSALHLYYTADKYDIQELKAFCTKYLMQNLKLQNVCDVASLADQYDEMSLFSAAQDFFIKNMNEILLTSEWKSFLKENSHVGRKLLTALAKHIAAKLKK